MTENTVKMKSLLFAKRIVKLYRYLADTKNETILSKQLLRSGTSVGANIAEAECSISKKEFLSKMQISFKECSETLFWLELLVSDDYLTMKEYESLKTDCEQIKKLLSSITKSTKANIKNS